MPNAIEALTIVKPDTVIRWHRAGFRSCWRWRSAADQLSCWKIRRLIRKMSIAKALWERQTWALQQVRQLSLGYPCFEINAESSNAIACG